MLFLARANGKVPAQDWFERIQRRSQPRTLEPPKKQIVDIQSFDSELVKELSHLAPTVEFHVGPVLDAVGARLYCRKKPSIPEPEKATLQNTANNQQIEVKEGPFAVEGEHEDPAWLQNAPYFANCISNVGNVVQYAKGVDDIEVPVRVRERSRIRFSQRDRKAPQLKVPSRVLKVPVRYVDSVRVGPRFRELHQVCPLTNADFKYALTGEGIELEEPLLPRLLPVALTLDRGEVVERILVAGNRPAGVRVPMLRVARPGGRWIH
jgi:hypothetical protein